MHPLSISPCKRLILRADGKPFFYLADTAWELFHRLTREEIGHFLAVRARQKFTVIQAVALAEFDGLRVPNLEGQLPLVDLDPLKPNEKYFELVDFAIDTCERLGLTMGLLPTWGDKVTPAWGAGPAVFTPENAGPYGAFLARRYASKPILWILGGDRPIQNDREKLIWRNMALGIRSVVGQRQLITFHPMGGGSSSKFVHHEPWLDFNMMQSGHTGRDLPNWTMVRADRALEPAKPTLDGEPNYEDHPVMVHPPGSGWMPIPGQYFDDYDVRKALWRALLSGAAGHTYGCHPIWQMFDDARHPSVNYPRHPWRVALELPGANQVRHARDFFESIDWGKLQPDDTLIESNGKEPASTAVAASASDGSYAIVYAPMASSLKVNLDRFGTMKAELLDPRTGERLPRDTASGHATITVPDRLDWVLVLTRG